MRRALLFSLAATVLLAVQATRSLQPGPQTQLNLFVGKTGFLSGKEHHFTFERFTGTADLAKLSLRLEIEAASIRCLDNWVSERDRNKILKVATEDMLAAGRYPILRFESQQVLQKSPSQFDIAGLLSIRDRTQSVRFTANREENDGFSGELKVRLSDFGLSPPSAALGLIGTKDEMRFTFQVALAGGQP